MKGKRISEYSASMARSTDPLVVGRVIGDVIDMFVSSMEVYYGSKQVTNGCKINGSKKVTNCCEIKYSATMDYPNLQIAGRHFDDSVYTVVPNL